MPVFDPEPILDFWGPYAKLRRLGGGGGICPCFTPSGIALPESARETVSLPRLAMLFSFLLSRARDFTTFTLHDLTDFYVERATAPHYNKLSFMFS